MLTPTYISTKEHTLLKNLHKLYVLIVVVY